MSGVTTAVSSEPPRQVTEVAARSTATSQYHKINVAYTHYVRFGYEPGAVVHVGNAETTFSVLPVGYDCRHGRVSVSPTM